MESLMEQLQAPFKPDEIEWRVGSTNSDKTKGLALAYVTNRAIQNRLDDLFGVFGWRNEYREWKDNSQLCGISVWSEDRSEWVTKWDGASDSNMDATKGGLSDAMKRAAYQWGIGRYLYNLPAVWMPLEKRGNSYVLKQQPKLPAWALPEGVKDEGVDHGDMIVDPDAVDTSDLDVSDEKKACAEFGSVHVGGNGSSGCEKCGVGMTAGQITVSKNKFDGHQYCLNCRKEIG